MANIQVIGDETTATGLKLAGLKQSYTADKRNINQKLDQVEDADILVITHSLYAEAREKLDRMEDKMVIEIPDHTGGGEDVVKQLIKEVLGFEISK